MAPTLGPDDGGGGLGFRTQVICAQEWQFCGNREQTSPSEHVGQVGVSGGHCTQRLKMVRSVRSTSASMLVFTSYGDPEKAVLRADVMPRTVVAIVVPSTSRGGS